MGRGEHYTGETACKGKGDRTHIRVASEHSRNDREGGAYEADGEAGQQADDKGEGEEDNARGESALPKEGGQCFDGAGGLEHALEHHDADDHEHDVE